MQEYFYYELGHCKEVVLSDSSGMPDDLWNLSTTSTHTSKFCKIGPWWSTIFKISPSLLAITCVPNHFPVLYISNIVQLVLQYCNIAIDAIETECVYMQDAVGDVAMALIFEIFQIFLRFCAMMLHGRSLKSFKCPLLCTCAHIFPTFINFPWYTCYCNVCK